MPCNNSSDSDSIRNLFNPEEETDNSSESLSLHAYKFADLL